MVGLLAPASLRVVELEMPQEGIRPLEVRAHREDLVNEVLNANDAVLAEPVLDYLIRREWDSLSIDAAETALIDQLAHRLLVGITPSDVRLGDTEHVECCLIKLNKGRVVDLAKTEELHNLARLGCDLVHTADPHHKGKLWLSRNVEVAVHPSLSL